MKLLVKLEIRLKRLKQAQNLTHPSSEDNYYYSGRIEEVEHTIKLLKENVK